jgi:hypothetical protein
MLTDEFGEHYSLRKGLEDPAGYSIDAGFHLGWDILVRDDGVSLYLEVT